MTSTSCAHCGAPLGHLKVFCSPCYFALPAPERIALRAMFIRRQDVTSKVAKCCRLLAERRPLKTP